MPGAMRSSASTTVTFAPRAPPHRAELEADIAGADHRQAPGNPRKRQRAGRIEYPLAVHGDAGKRRRLGPGGDDDAAGGHDALAAGPVHGDRGPAFYADEAGGAADALHPVALEQAGDAAGEAGDSALLLRHHRGKVEFDPARRIPRFA